MNQDETYMQRCIELARLGTGSVAPNPLVGAVLVYQDRIIGEGWHRQYGQAHAEVNCINSVSTTDLPSIQEATLYVSLEPCAHYGKTPPCSDLIIEKKIPRVVIGCRDPFKEVNGRGIEKLKRAGIMVEVGILEEACKLLNKRFLVFHQEKRPYVLLKWAQTADHKIAPGKDGRLLISHAFSNRLVHRWRSEEAAILVGTRTALLDNPSLDNRLWNGGSPIRMVIDKDLSLPSTLKLFNQKQHTIVFNCHKEEKQNRLWHYKLDFAMPVIPQLLKACYHLQIQSILVEGGSNLLQQFIDEATWDEARVITNRQLHIGDGLEAPLLTNARIIGEEHMATDQISYYFNGAFQTY